LENATNASHFRLVFEKKSGTEGNRLNIAMSEFYNKQTGSPYGLLRDLLSNLLSIITSSEVDGTLQNSTFLY